jgi:polyisoprenoid-binding protein YceI
VTITAASIDTQVAKRDNDLRSARHLDTDTYPAITFASTLLTEYPGSRWGLEGDLTIKDITRPVELLTEFTGSAIDNLGNAKVAFLARDLRPPGPGDHQGGDCRRQPHHLPRPG